MIERVCLSEDEALAFSSGQAADLGRLEEHLDECAECRQLVALLASAPVENERPRVFAGQRIGRFELRMPAGAGAMGLVFEAHDPVLGRRVAIKLLRIDPLADVRDAQLRLVEEYRALAKLSHPNVVTLYEAGSHGAEVYLAMEFIDGATIASWLTSRPSRSAIVDAYVQAGRGLAAVHGAGVLHRDIKPSNLLRGTDGRVRIGDFGVAREIGNRDRSIAGTPHYMAPEVRRGERATAASDQWSFAASLAEALGTSGGRRVNAITARGMAADAAARWPSVAAMTDALARKRRTSLAVGAAVVALAIAAIAIVPHREATDPCLDRGLVGAWDPIRTAALTRAFVATGKPTALHIASEVSASLHARARSWNAIHGEVCRDPSPANALRTACLERQRSALGATVDDLLAVRPTTKLVSALELAGSLPFADACSSLEQLVKSDRLPTDPARRLELAATTAELDAAVRAWRLTADGSALAVARRALQAAGDFAPLRARALQVIAAVQRSAADPACVETVHEAATAAAAAGDVVMQAELALALVDTNSVVPMPAREQAWALADADARISSVARFAPQTAARLRFYYLLAKGTLEHASGRAADAVVDLEAAIAAGSKVYGVTSWFLARSRGSLASALVRQGLFERASREIEPSLAVIEATLGPDHPELASQYHLAAGAAFFVGQLPHALALSNRALAIANVRSPPGVRMEILELHGGIAMALGDLRSGIADLELQLHLGISNPPAAGLAHPRALLACARRARVARLESAKVEVVDCFIAEQRPQAAFPLLEAMPHTAPTEFARARALWSRHLPGDVPRALDSARAARAKCERQPKLRELEHQIDAWLTEASAT